MRTLIAIVASAVAFTAWAKTIQGDGKPSTETRDVSSFEAVKLEAAADVIVHVGPAVKVTVTGDSNLLPHLKTDVRSGALVIATDQGLDSKTPLRVEISAPSLRRLELNGAGDVTVDGGRGDEELVVRGSGEVRWSGEAGKLSASIDGSGDVALQGKARELAVRIAGSGDVDAKKLDAHDVDVRVDGSGDVRVHIDGGTLRAVVSGTGNVEWSGSASVEKAQTHGTGHIRKT